MALTPSAAWYEAVCRADADLRFLVSFTDGVTTWTAVDGPMDSGSDLAGTVVGVQDVSVVSMEVDPVRRRLQASELFVNFDDPYLRPIVVANRIETLTLTVHLGAASLDNAEFVDFFSGPIDTVTPVSGDDPKIVTTVLSAVDQLTTRLITGWWVTKNPLEILYTGDGKGVLEKAGSFSYDASSFDPSDAAYDDIAHLIFSRVRSFYATLPTNPANTATLYEQLSTGVDEPTAAIEIVNSISELLGGTLVFDEAGQASFSRFDPTASAVDAWSDDDIIPGTLVQEPLGQNIINRIHVDYRESGDPDIDEVYKRYMVDDSESQAIYGVRDHQISTSWINMAAGWLAANINDAVVTMDLQGGDLHAMSGNRSDAWAQISATLPLYLTLHSRWYADVNEVIKAESMTRDATVTGDLLVIEPAVPGTGGAEVVVTLDCCRLQIGNVTRGALGSDNHPHGAEETYISDITAIVLQADALLARFKYGCDVFTVDTLLNKYEIQLGDLVTPTLSDYLAYGKNGLAGTEKYEVISKEVDVYADPPVIHWKLMSTNTHALIRAVGLTLYGSDTVTAHRYVQEYFVESGLVVSDGGGLKIDITKGIATDGKVSRNIPATTGRALPASKDVYVKMDRRTKSIVYDPVTIDAAAPTQHSYEELLSKVVTGVAGITSVDNTVRTEQPVHGNKLIDETVDTTQLADLAATSAKIGPAAVVAGKIATGGVSASTQIAASVVGVEQSLGADVRSTINRNSHFLQHTRG